MRAKDWTAWSFWAPEHAPWVGLGVQEMANVLDQLADQHTGITIPAVLNHGGSLTADQTLALHLFLVLNPHVPQRLLDALKFAVDHGHGVRVEISPQAPMTAVMYLANKGSERS
jgi:hypothetical protein